MRPALFIFAVLGAFFASSALACEGCGCRGGPGYRGPDGRCVGWARLNKICGNPPTRCAYEALSALPALKSAAPDQPPPQEPQQTPPVTTNIQPALSDGLGCIDAATIQTVSSCEAGQGAKNCEQQRTALIGSKTCFAIHAGTTGAIEASSEFELIRVRVPETIQPLWTPRSLFLNN